MEPCCTAHIGPIWVPIWDPYRLLAGNLAHIFFEVQTTFFFLSFSTGMIAREHYVRECEFGILKKNKTKQQNKTKLECAVDGAPSQIPR